MASAKAKENELAAWLAEMQGGKFDSPVGAKRSLGYKKHWPKADRTKAEEAIEKHFASSKAKAPAPAAATKAPVAAKKKQTAPLTQEDHAWAADAEAVVSLSTAVVNANSRALMLMEKGLIPFDVESSQVMGSNITRACLEMARVLPSAAVKQVVQEAADEAAAEKPAEDEAEEEADGPDKFRAR